MSLRIEPIEPVSAPEALLTRLHDVWVQWEEECLPGDPHTPAAQRIADFRFVRSDRLMPKWLAWYGDDLIGWSGAYIDIVTEGDVNTFITAFLLKEHRGKGYARALIEPAVAISEEHGRTRVAAEMPMGHPSGRLVERMGLKPAMVAKRSRLVIADVDVDLMKRWIERAEERASDYTIVFYPSPMPEEVVPKFAELMNVMNTAPLEDYEEEPRAFTEEMWREREEHVARTGEEIITCVAVHKPSGEWVGYTNIDYQGLFPEQAWQWDTGVDPEHRNRGLGRWLKGAMILELIAKYPQVDRIDTYNAGSNEPMLNINVEMGYKPIYSVQIYQGPLAGVRAWVDAGS